MENFLPRAAQLLGFYHIRLYAHVFGDAVADKGFGGCQGRSPSLLIETLGADAFDDAFFHVLRDFCIQIRSEYNDVFPAQILKGADDAEGRLVPAHIQRLDLRVGLDHIHTYLVGVFDLPEASACDDLHVGEAVQRFFGGGVPLPGAVENSAVDDQADLDVGLPVKIFSQHTSGVSAVFCFVYGNAGNVAVFSDVFGKIADENKFGDGGQLPETVCGELVVGRDGDHGVRFLDQNALELHVLEIGVKMRVHDRYDVYSVLFQLVPDPFLVKLRPGCPCVVERDRDPVAAVPELFFLFLGQGDLGRRYGFFAVGSVFQYPGGFSDL